jgi:hypothetical protein
MNASTKCALFLLGLASPIIVMGVVSTLLALAVLWVTV